MNKYCKMLNKLWLNALIMVLFASLFAILFVWKYGTMSYISGKWILYYGIVAMAAMICCLFLGNNSMAKKIKKLREEDLQQKLIGYKAVYNKKLKFFSAISLVAIISMILLNNLFYAIFAALSLLLIIVSRAMPFKVKYELNLSEEDTKRIDKIKL
ncbi:MAG: hypothetical protein LBO06_03770 [Bacteroidales bacterium]|nr:hypothetical protein [Bacteroidales bacterium]